MGRLFGTDGIRGEANRPPLDGVTAFRVGQAVAHLLKGADGPPAVIIGRDTRLSGHMLASALEAGVSSMGGIPRQTGVLPTPGIAFMARTSAAAAGIAITASHNPYQDNGIKIFAGSGFKLSDEQEEALEGLVLEEGLEKRVPLGAGLGIPRPVEDASVRYASFLKKTFSTGLSASGVKIVLDAANGAAYEVAPAVFRGLGADVEVLHNTPDGTNINDHCGSQFTQDLEKRVRQTGAHMGLAFDGDGDRLIAVDEEGKTLTGDQVLLLCARDLHDQGRLKQDLLISTVMSNLGLKVACRRFGFSHHASEVGDRHVLADMRRLGAVIGGEDSGHTIFLEHHTTGDGILTGVQVLAAVLRMGRPLSELGRMMDVFPQKLLNVEVKDKPELSTVPSIMEAIEQVEAELGEEGRVLVRYSGTQRVCRVMVEGPTLKLTERFCRRIADAVEESLG